MIILIEKNFDPYIMSYVHLNSRWTQDLYVKNKPKVLEISLYFHLLDIQENTKIPRP